MAVLCHQRSQHGENSTVNSINQRAAIAYNWIRFMPVSSTIILLMKPSIGNGAAVKYTDHPNATIGQPINHFPGQSGDPVS